MAGQTMHPIWGLSMRALRRSLYANQVLSSIVHEWIAMNPMRDATLRSGLVGAVNESSAKRNTAIGHMIRLHFVPSAVVDEVQRLTSLVVQEMSDTRETDRAVADILAALSASGDVPDAWYQLAVMWSVEQRRWLRVSRRTLRDVITPDLFAITKQSATDVQTHDRE